MEIQCIKCGVPLPAGAKFCPRCGAAVQNPKTSGVRISEDGAGGLVFDIPEGSTVSISDAAPDCGVQHGITVTEDGNGGLVFDVPDGTAVVLSDEPVNNR